MRSLKTQKITYFSFLLFLLSIVFSHLVSAQQQAPKQDTVYRDKVKELLASDSLRLLQVNDSTFMLELGDTLYLLSLSSVDYIRQVQTSGDSSAAALATSPEQEEEENPWSLQGSFALNFSNVGFSNWAGGGNPAISVGGIFALDSKRETDKSVWEYHLRTAYGITRVGGFGVEKSDDDLRFSTQYSRKFDKNWSISFRSEFGSQFNDGYQLDNTTRERLDLISSILAPARLEISSGIRFASTFGKEKQVQISNTISPATGKMTFVLDERVDETDYGLEEGNTVLSEVGIQLYSSIEAKPIKNLNLQNTLRLFANYRHIENIDVNWETLLVYKINKFFNTNFSTNLIYDDDTDIAVKNDAGEVIASGPRVQFKHVLNVGMNFIF